MLNPVESGVNSSKNLTSKLIILNSSSIPYLVAEGKAAEIISVRATSTASFHVYVNGISILGSMTNSLTYPVFNTPIPLSEGDVVSINDNNGIVLIKEYSYE